jgi:hypothetical protein
VKLLALSALHSAYGLRRTQASGLPHLRTIQAALITQNIEMDHCTSPIKCAKLHVAYKPECSTVSPEK